MTPRKMCPNCRAFVDAKAKTCEYCGNEIGVPAWQQKPASRQPSEGIFQGNFTTVMILLVNFALFSASLIMTYKQGKPLGLMDGVDGYVLELFGAKQRFLILHGEWWRLITAGFLHGSVLHILMNSWVLFDLGFRVEELFGTARFLVIYFVSGACGFVASTLWTPHLSIGASAGIFGLIGGIIASGYRVGNSTLVSMYLKWVLIILIVGFLPFFPFDNAAHLGGLVAGCLVGYGASTPKTSHPVELFWKAMAGVSVALVGLSFYMAYQSLSRTLLF